MTAIYGSSISSFLMIQCITMSEHEFYVRAIGQRRRAEWNRIFGDDQLPVRSSLPAPTPAGCLAYRLDENRLHWMQRERLVNYLVRRERMTIKDARLLVIEGLPIPSGHAVLVCNEQESSRASAHYFLEQLVYATRPQVATMQIGSIS